SALASPPSSRAADAASDPPPADGAPRGSPGSIPAVGRGAVVEPECGDGGETNQSTTRPPAANPRTKVHAGTCAIERGVFGIRGPQRMPAVASTLRIVVSGTCDVKAQEPERPRGKLRIGLVLHGAAP